MPQSGLSAGSSIPNGPSRSVAMVVLNDVQSRLNQTSMERVVAPANVEEVAAELAQAAADGLVVCPTGAMHSMGGQQFVTGGVSISSRELSNVGPLDSSSGTVWVQSGVTWPGLVSWLQSQQSSASSPLTIIQKQTGADELTLGGALSSNIHGRVLDRKPIVDDIEAFYTTLPCGERVRCSRTENPDLFSGAVGGYGMFGFIDSLKLRLEPRRQLVRRVREIATGDVIDELESQVKQGATYGDFQYMTDESSKDFMLKGILSTYTPTGEVLDIPEDQVGLSADDWTRLYVLAHTDKTRAYTEYREHYLQTDSQIYWSDDHQFSPYLPEAGDLLARSLGWATYKSLMISELYVPRDRFEDFMHAARESLLNTRANVVYGTVRLIEAEDETILRWAKQDYACIIFNLLVEHSPEGIDRATTQFRQLIDCALHLDGSYYLTYHRWARPDQLQLAYPSLSRFFEFKDQYDPGGLLTSDWYRALRNSVM